MRSILSLIASIEALLACAIDRAWLAVLCAPEAAEAALAAALLAAAAAALAFFASSLCSLLTCDFRSSICAWIGFRSVHPANATRQAAAAVTFNVVANFILNSPRVVTSRRKYGSIAA